MTDEEMEQMILQTPNKLREALDRHERTAAWAAKQIGVSESHLSQVLNEECRPSLKLAMKIEGFLKWFSPALVG